MDERESVERKIVRTGVGLEDTTTAALGDSVAGSVLDLGTGNALKDPYATTLGAEPGDFDEAPPKPRTTKPNRAQRRALFKLVKGRQRELARNRKK